MTIIAIMEGFISPPAKLLTENEGAGIIHTLDGNVGVVKDPHTLFTFSAPYCWSTGRVMDPAPGA